MNANSGDFIAVHRKPAWREISDILFHVHIGFANGRNEWEQLWGKSLSSNDVLLCCIPFFSYGLSLGDIVKIDEGGNFSKIAEKADQITIRVWFAADDIDRKRGLLCDLEEAGALREFHSKNLLALSINTDQQNDVEKLLVRLEHMNLISYEFG